MSANASLTRTRMVLLAVALVVLALAAVVEGKKMNVKSAFESGSVHKNNKVPAVPQSGRRVSDAPCAVETEGDCPGSGYIRARARVGSRAADRRPASHRNSGSLVVAQYNVDNLFDGLGHGGVDDECTPDECRAHSEAVANVIASLDADIVHLAEVESCSVLDTLLSWDVLADAGYDYFLVAGYDTYLCQNVAILSRIDPVMKLSRNETTATSPVPGGCCAGEVPGESHSVSKHLATEFNVDGNTIYLVGAHLLSLSDEEHCVEREDQATVLSGYANALIGNRSDSHTHLIMLGDFNDEDAEVAPAGGEGPDGCAVSIMKQNSLASSGGAELRNVVANISEQAQRYTYVYDGEGELLDHILVSPHLYDRLVSVDIPKNYTLGADSNSDHYPIVARFRLDVPVPTATPTPTPTPTPSPSPSQERASRKRPHTGSKHDE